MEKFETPPDSPPVVVIDLDDQPTWSSTMTVAPTPSFAIVQIPVPHKFNIKGTHMQMNRDNQFDGRIQSDPHQHVADSLKISNLFLYGENQEEAVMLRTFPFSLSGEAKTWLNELDEGTITLGNKMREAFISRHFSLVKFESLLNEIHNFYQLANETPVEAVLEFCRSLTSAAVSNVHCGSIEYGSAAKKLDKMEIWLEDELKNQDQNVETASGKDGRHLDNIAMTSKEFMTPSGSAVIREALETLAWRRSIEEDETKPIPTMPNPNPIKSNSPTVLPFLNDYTVHIPYINAKTFTDVVLSNHVGDKELKSFDSVGTRRMTKKDGIRMPQEPHKGWKLNENVFPHNKDVYHYQWH
nr:reverse transcriptase domain-containing protein [Tanacetum cinerariifolium]